MALTTGSVHTYTQNTNAYVEVVAAPDGRFFAAYHLTDQSISIDVYNSTTKSWSNYTTISAAQTGAAHTTIPGAFDLVITADGKLHIALAFDENDGAYPFDDLRGISYGVYDGVSWSFTTVDSGRDLNGGGFKAFDTPSLKVDANGRAHIAYEYSDATTFDYYAKYATNASGSFVTEFRASYTSDTNAGINEIHEPVINIGLDGTLYLTYNREDNINAGNGNIYFQSKSPGGSWSSEVLIDGTYGVANSHNFTETSIDAAGKLHMFYVSGGAVYDLNNVSGVFTTQLVIPASESVSSVRGYQEVNGVEYLLVTDTTSDTDLFSRNDGGAWVNNTQGARGAGDTDIVVNAQGQMMIVLTSTTADRMITFATDQVAGAAPQAPILSANTVSTVSEGGVHQITNLELRVTDGDTAAGSLIFTLDSAPARGTLFLDNDGSGSLNAGDTTLTVNSTFTQANIDAGRLRYVHDGSETTSDSFQFHVSDGTTTLSNKTFNLAVTAVNDAPVLMTNATGALAYTENASAANIVPGLTLSDVDSALLTGATVRIFANFTAGQDQLIFVNQNGISGSYNSATGILTLSGSATKANYQAALASVSYQNTSDNPSTAPRTIAFTATDGSDTSATVTRDITITAVNDAPVLVTNATGSLAYTENASATSIAPGLTLSDVDSALLTGATVRISANFTAGQDQLVFVNQNGISGSYNSATGILTLSGPATKTNYQAALASVSYQNTSDDPSTAARTIAFTATDGSDTSATVTREVTVTAVNDAPTATGLLQTLTVQEDAAATPLFAVAPTVADVDSAMVTATLTLVDPNNGSLTGAGVGANGVYTVTGSPAAVAAALADVTFVPAPNFNGTNAVTVSISDNQNGPQGSNPTGTISIIVNAVNDPPEVSGPAVNLPNGNEDEPYTIHQSDLIANYRDLDGDPLKVLNLLADHGTVVDNLDGTFTITPDRDYIGTMTLTYDVSDGTESTSATQNYTIDNVNELPIAIDDTANVRQRATVRGDVIAGPPTDTDSDGGSLTVSGIAYGSGSSVTVSKSGTAIAGAYGTLTIETDGSYVYTADGTAPITVGAQVADTFHYTLSDGQGGEDSADLVITVTGSDTGSTGNDRFFLTGTDSQASGLGGDDIYLVDAATDRVIEAANGGHDIVRTSASYTLPANVEELRAYHATRGLALTGNAEDNTIIGGDFGDSLNGGAGNDRLFGGGGADRIIGGVGVDNLYGEAGNDRFVFGSVAHSSSTERDRIRDFSKGDTIDLSAIKTGASDGHFHFAAGATAFHKQAGELIAVQMNGYTAVYGDTNGDGRADLAINVVTDHKLTLADFDLA